MLDAMRICCVAILPLLCSVLWAQPENHLPSFEVASVRQCKQTVGPDYNNQITITAKGIAARNATLKRLIADAWGVQVNQVTGPEWLEHNEYDLSARLANSGNGDQVPLMLRNLLGERFKLRTHTETREMTVFELKAAPTGIKIHPAKEGEPVPQGQGLQFSGDMRRLADLLAVQFSIPAAVNPNMPVKAGGAPIIVLDKTGLSGIYNFTVDIRPEPDTDVFTAWRRVLNEQLGLTVEHRKDLVPVVVVDDALRIPTEN